MDLFESFCLNLKEKAPFTFSRFGDGEWSAILGREGANCDGHGYFPDMGAALANVLRSNPEYFVGMQNHAMRTMGPEIIPWAMKNKVDLDYMVNADVWHYASIHGEFQKFFDAIRGQEVMLVGPATLRELKWTYFVGIPDKNCWLAKDTIMRHIEKSISYVDIVLFSAGMPSNVMIHELYRVYGKNKTLLDMGSVFDPYAGRTTRSYHKKLLEQWEAKK